MFILSIFYRLYLSQFHNTINQRLQYIARCKLYRPFSLPADGAARKRKRDRRKPSANGQADGQPADAGGDPAAVAAVARAMAQFTSGAANGQQQGRGGGGRSERFMAVPRVDPAANAVLMQVRGECRAVQQLGRVDF